MDAESAARDSGRGLPDRRPAAHLELTSAADDASVVVLKSRSSEEARREGERVARFLKTTLQDPFRARREEVESTRR